MEFKSVNYGELAYNAYGKHVDWKNFQGNSMPKFDELPEKIKEAWVVAAHEVMSIMNEYNMHMKDE